MGNNPKQQQTEQQLNGRLVDANGLVSTMYASTKQKETKKPEINYQKSSIKTAYDLALRLGKEGVQWTDLMDIGMDRESAKRSVRGARSQKDMAKKKLPALIYRKHTFNGETIARSIHPKHIKAHDKAYPEAEIFVRRRVA